jgi:hypothetical protein
MKHKILITGPDSDLKTKIVELFLENGSVVAVSLKRIYLKYYGIINHLYQQKI